MSRKEVENSILRDLQDKWQADNDFDSDIEDLYGASMNDEELRTAKAEMHKDDELDKYNAMSESEKRIRDKREKRIIEGQVRNEDQQARRQAEFDKLNNFERFKYGLNNAFGEAKTDHQKSYWEARTSQDLDIEAPRLQQIFGTNPTVTRARDLIREAEFLPNEIGPLSIASNLADYESRKVAGLGLEQDGYAKTGQIAGTLLSDINQDRLRNFWWLMNAPQAVTNVFQELGLSRAAPDLYASDKITDEKGFEITLEEGNYDELAKRDLIRFDPEGKPVLKAGVNRVNAIDSGNEGKYALSKRRYRPGMVDALQIPSALAINAGVGLLNPFGGSNGYSAVFESEDDPTKTNNIVGEVAAKYILGRTGNVLPWDEFKKVRPDVSKDQYMRYKAFKYDKEGDFDITDGDFTLPTGVLKGTMDGIHGAELQFLGRSMPVLTTMLPVAAAGVGTALGARWQPEKFNEWRDEKKQMRQMLNDQTNNIKGRNLSTEVRDDQIRNITKQMQEAKREVWQDKERIQPGFQKEYKGINRTRNGIVSGLASYAVAQGAGLLLENERRRRNQESNDQRFE